MQYTYSDNSILHNLNINGFNVDGTFTDGQLLIGKTSTSGLNATTLTAGTGISITPGSGSITITNSATAPSGVYFSGHYVNSTGTSNTLTTLGTYYELIVGSIGYHWSGISAGTAPRLKLETAGKYHISATITGTMTIATQLLAGIGIFGSIDNTSKVLVNNANKEFSISFDFADSFNANDEVWVMIASNADSDTFTCHTFALFINCIG